jgi:hypothetical protein
MAEQTRSPTSPTTEAVVPSLGTGAPRPDRTFDEAAVAQILKRVASLEQRRRTSPAGLSVAEIEQIAREAGLDPALVQQAVRDLEHQEKAEGSGRFTGTPTVRTLERLVPGELQPEDHEALAMEIRAALAGLGDHPAQVASLGRSLTVSASDGRVFVEVQLTPRSGQTLIRITVNASRFARGLFGGLLGGVGGGVGTNVLLMVSTTLNHGGTPLPLAIAGGVAGLLGVFGTAFASARAIFSNRVGRVHRTMEQLADRLERDLGARSPRP